MAVAPLLVTALVAGCTSGDGGNASSPYTPGPVGAPIAWRDCSSQVKEMNATLPSKTYTVECGAVSVPQDWKTAKDGKPADGKTFSIAVIRIHRKDQQNPLGSILINPGGPGGSGVEYAAGVANDLSPLLRRFDLIGFDPRGVGRSDPVKCFSAQDLDASFGSEPDPRSDAEFQDIVSLSRRMNEACQAKYGDGLALYSTEQAARDMDAIRKGLGEQKLNYLGFSYGTLLGATYAQLFPTTVRAMVLDGAVDPTQNAADSSEGQAKGFELALSNFVTWCQFTGSSCPISDDPLAAINTAMDRARTNPLKASDGRRVTAGWVFYSVLYPLYSRQLWPYLGTAIANLNKGDPRVAMLLADTYAERQPDGSYKNTFDANAAVNCTDGDYPTLEQIRALQDQWRSKYPFFGASSAIGLVSCAVWPGKKDPYPAGKAAGAPPIVVVGTINDPATPYASTAKLADMLGVGTVVTWQGEGHTAYPNTQCIRSAVDNYLIDLKVPAKGLTCPAG
jgi:pimeloyl-ACP methyl ester carboxylesterase